MIDPVLKHQLIEFYKSGKPLIILTGAGASAESGIPTFRGPEGYWKVGSVNYTPQEIGTFRMFQQNPWEVWKWYLFRRTVCQQSKPNPGHYAIAQMAQLMGDRFTLITQNVDGLHLRAGNSLEKTYLIHGSLEYVRCSVECTDKLYPFPENIGPKTRDSEITEAEKEALICPDCGALLRPHILWFDEFYNEKHFKFKSSLEAAAEAELLITIGTSGATTLPNHILDIFEQERKFIIDVNIEPNLFSHTALHSPNGYFLQGPSGQILPEIRQIFQQEASQS